MTSVSVNINLGEVNFMQKKKRKKKEKKKRRRNFGKNVDFFIKCALLLKVIILMQNMLIFRKM